MSIEQITKAEKYLNCNDPRIDLEDPEDDASIKMISKSSFKQFALLVHWAKIMDHFKRFSMSDKILLLTNGLNELIILTIAYRSMEVPNRIVLAGGLTIENTAAAVLGIEPIFDRIVSELVTPMKETRIDKTELGCLKALILYNPTVPEIKSVADIKKAREDVYNMLEEYVRRTHPKEPARFLKLLQRLLIIKSIASICLEHLFVSNLVGDIPFDAFLTQMLENKPSKRVMLTMISGKIIP